VLPIIFFSNKFLIIIITIMPRINVNLEKMTHEKLKIYALRRKINMDEATNKLLLEILEEVS